MMDDYDGTEVLDAAGARIGTVERTFIDDRGEADFVEVKMGGWRTKHRLVPIGQVERVDDALKVPFDKDVVEESPDASSAGDTLEGDMLTTVRAYYARRRDQGTGTTETVEESAAVPVHEPSPSRASSAPESNHEEGMVEKAKRAAEQVRETGRQRSAAHPQEPCL